MKICELKSKPCEFARQHGKGEIRCQLGKASNRDKKPDNRTSKMKECPFDFKGAK